MDVVAAEVWLPSARWGLRALFPLAIPSYSVNA